MQQKATDFFDAYLDYIGETEAPILYHRWASLAAIAAILEKNYYIPHGHGIIYPNIYCMLIGSPGARKSTAIKIAAHLVKQTGYKNIAANKTTKEKFLSDLAEQTEVIQPDELADFLQGNAPIKTASTLIAADEFNDFAGAGNLEFYSILGSLWDIKEDFSYRIKGGKEMNIKNPAVTLLSGNTHTGFSAAFPPEIIGQGFFSRLLLIHGQPTGTKIAFPSPPSAKKELEIVARLKKIVASCRGQVSLSPDAKKALTDIYESTPDVIDPRFDSYYQRRFTHLIKLCLLHAASTYSMTIELEHVILSNTILSHTEHLMPKALGEFGKSRHADVLRKIMTTLESAKHPLSMLEIWEYVQTDLDKMGDLADLMRNLYEAGKIQKVEPHSKFLPKKKQRIISGEAYVDYSLLTLEEQNDGAWS
jgi:hypothetical protein